MTNDQSLVELWHVPILGYSHEDIFFSILTHADLDFPNFYFYNIVTTKF